MLARCAATSRLPMQLSYRARSFSHSQIAKSVPFSFFKKHTVAAAGVGVAVGVAIVIKFSDFQIKIRRIRELGEMEGKTRDEAFAALDELEEIARTGYVWTIPKITNLG